MFKRLVLKVGYSQLRSITGWLCLKYKFPGWPGHPFPPALDVAPLAQKPDVEQMYLQATRLVPWTANSGSTPCSRKTIVNM
jgi:hypothetical protein